MKLKRIKIGSILELCNKKCGKADLTVNDVSGINKDKEFFEPSKQVGKDTSNYKIVPPNYFACNLMHIGRDVVLPIALNNTKKDKYVSPAYTVFKIMDEGEVLNKYLFMLLKSNEKDRYFWFHCDSSVRDGMDWNTFCDVEIDIPPIEIQKKYVAIYESLLHNLKVYESKLDDLKLICDGYIEKLKINNKVKCIGEYLQEVNEKNTNTDINLFQGVNVNHEFMEAKRTAKDKESCKIVKKGQFAYNKVLKANNTKLPIALREGEDCLVSSSYQVFEVTKTQELVPEYLKLWFDRKETERFAGFIALGTTRDTFDFNDLCQIKIPIPRMEEQNSIVKIMNVLNTRKKFVEKLKYQIQNLCPILIKG